MSSANGLLLKGGKEAAHSNKYLMQLVKESLDTVGAANAISLISTREDVGDLLSMGKQMRLRHVLSIRSLRDQGFHHRCLLNMGL
ncbi:Delta-1-pyrroline-5-carboxylate synthase [Anthophora quadrimaculata]